MIGRSVFSLNVKQGISKYVVSSCVSRQTNLDYLRVLHKRVFLFHRNDEGTKMTRKHSNKSNRTGSAEKTVKDIRRATRKNYGSE